MRRARLGLQARLFLALAGLSVLAAGTALLLQERSLSRDLERAAIARLDRAAHAAETLLTNHLATVEQRYHAITRTPVFRANLEVEHAPTLHHYAEQLRDREGAVRIVFLNRDEEIVAAVGDPRIDAAALSARGADLVSSGGQVYAVVSLPVETSHGPVGRMAAAEVVASDTIAAWSELCGADLLVLSANGAAAAAPSRTVRKLGELVLVARATLSSERAALGRARLGLLLAGLAAIAAALAASFWMARGMVGWVRRLKDAVQAIGQGEYDVRLAVDRADELGEVSAAINEMAGHLSGHRASLEASVEEIRALNADLVEARDAAEASSRAKTAFLTNMSHEIRTPMTSILGYLDLLMADDGASSERAVWAGAVRSNGQTLLAIINSILDLSRLEADRLELDPQPFSPRALVEDVLAVVRRPAQEKGLELVARIGPDVPDRAQTDLGRLRQILVNLLGNAVKFTNEGSVELMLDSFAEGTARSLRFDVRDSGIGIESEDQERIFEPFAQADASTTRSFGGTGLGLTISRRLANLLGGELRVSSRPGEGSVFSLRVPIEPAPSAKAEAEAADSPAEPASACVGGRVLLAEDSPDSRRLLQLLLRKLGVEVEVVENGRAAVDLALAARESGEPFDLVLMDMQMPVLDGYEATRELRAACYAEPIVALTAHAMKTDRQRCLDAGCDEHVTKPIDLPRLRATLTAHLKQT